jgi:PAN domain
MRLVQPIVLLIIGFAISLPGGPSAAQGQQNTDRLGRDYHMFEMSNPDPRVGAKVCDEECWKDRRTCRAWTYVRAGVQGPLARCYMKNAVPQAKPNPCCISGTVGTFD